MIIRRLDDLHGTEAEVHCNTWVSRRLLLKRDGMGFSMHDTVIRAGTETPMWYKNHLEAVYCIEGRGTVEDRATGEVHALEPGTLYALDKNDRHIVRAEKDLRLVCVFNPPVTGREVHDADGGYEIVDDEEEAA